MSKGKIVAGTIIGAVAGFATGVLTAPKSGKETREDIKEASIKAKDVTVAEATKWKGVAADEVAHVKETVSQEAKKAKEQLDAKAQQAKEAATDVIEEVGERADELKNRSQQAVEGAKKGFFTDPNGAKKR